MIVYRPKSPPTARKLRLAGLCALLALSGRAPGQDEQERQLVALARNGTIHDLPDAGYLGVSQALRDVRNDCCVALLASHPDDQYVLLAAWLRQHGGYRQGSHRGIQWGGGVIIG